MPEFTGLDLAKAMRDAGLIDTPIIAISANEPELATHESKNLFSDYVSKPFKKETLLKTILKNKFS